ncbi:MAG: 2-phosphosulfolactate phosphatase [Planctomycetota bacterium]
MPTLNVHYLPQFVAEADLAGGTAIVVDLLRASTTICQALANGAKCVVPSVEVDATFALAQGYERSEIVLGGERGGEIIEGFDLGNCPSDYTADQVFNRTVLFTTTNGTKAINHARLADRVLVGCAANRRAVSEVAADSEQVDILCAGTNGKVTREDILAAGAIAHRLATHHAPPATPWSTNEWADSARGEWEELLNTATALNRTADDQFAIELQDTLGGKNLLALGFDDDLVTCAQLDKLKDVPALDKQSGEFRLL